MEERKSALTQKKRNIEGGGVRGEGVTALKGFRRKNKGDVGGAGC